METLRHLNESELFSNVSLLAFTFPTLGSLSVFDIDCLILQRENEDSHSTDSCSVKPHVFRPEAVLEYADGIEYYDGINPVTLSQ